MSILIVDDSTDMLRLLQVFLKSAGYTDILFAESAQQAFEVLGVADAGSHSAPPGVELILMDIMMPAINGIDACARIKSHEHLRDIPIIMVSGVTEATSLQAAFNAGAVDYVTKPVNKIELVTRVRTVMKLKDEFDNRKARQEELVELNKQLTEKNKLLNKLSSIDFLTNIANRRTFEQILETEWRRSLRNASPLSALMIDIDFFKRYNDTYGHMAGDECITSVAKALQETLKRPADIVARYGGEEFVVLLPDSGIYGAVSVGEAMRRRVQQLAMPHVNSEAANIVTVSIGAASVVPEMDTAMVDLITSADKALYEAKHEGRNRVKAYVATETEANVPQPPAPKQYEHRARNDLSQAILDGLAINVAVLDRDGVIVSVNRSWQEYAVRQDASCLLGITEGANYVEKCSATQQRCKQYSMPASEGVEAVFSGQTQRFEFEYRCSDNMWFLMHAVPLDREEGGVVISYFDITRLKGAEAEIKTLYAVVDESINIIYITDKDARIQYVNKTFEQITGYTKAEVIGTTPHLLSSGQTTHEQYEGLWNTISAGKTWRGIFKNKKKNGEFFWINGLVSVIKNDAGEITNYLAIQEDITDKMKSKQTIEYISYYDRTTRLLNRNRFMALLDQWIVGQSGSGAVGALLLVNLDAFKLINDTYGYIVGDEFLASIADMLRRTVSGDEGVDYDADNQAVNKVIVGRIGGDEFGVFIPDMGTAAAVEQAEGIRKQLEAMRFSEFMIRTSASIGIVIYPEHGTSTRELITRGDAAIYRAKELGQNRCHLYSNEDQYLEDIQVRLKEREQIKWALENNRFVPWFQPILDLRTNMISHYEALARMQVDERKVLYPPSFLYTAEKYGFIGSIDRMIIQKTLTVQSQVVQAKPHLSFGMNLSGKDLGDEQILHFIKDQIDILKVDPTRLIFEVTETAAISDLVKAIRSIKGLKELGCRISLDDFGVGFTSFKYLKDMEVDYIKIDGSFVKNLLNSDENRHIVKAIRDMAGGMGIMTVAEFVEDVETMNLLRDYGVDYAQGYLIGKPSPNLKQEDTFIV
ncbi:MAG: diguanylate cyclase [Candidatus Magnetobacterium sp. LHC-1]|nr:diguanylate cyclase [Nitrospirota bacterium]